MASLDDLDLYCEAAVSLAKEAGEIIKAAWKKKKNIAAKTSDVDLVTETDQQVEKVLLEGFKSKFPDHRFIGEESTAAGMKAELTDAPTWIIDPVDGTMNFIHGFPYCAVSIGLAINKEVVVGVVYNPILDQMFTACKGKGAYCNGSKLEVSHQKELALALLVVEHVLARYRAEVADANVKTLLSSCHGLRAMGSAALNMCHVASGACDAYFEFGIHCWDIAAGSLIVLEAGGVVMDTETGPLDMMERRVLCASSLELAEAVSKKLQHVRLERD